MVIIQIIESDGDSPEAYYVDGRLYATIHANDRHEIKPMLLKLMLGYTVIGIEFYTLTEDGEGYVNDNDGYYSDFGVMSDLVKQTDEW